MSTLERAIVIAAEAHAGRKDKAGAPYILHPLRVMLAVPSVEERIVAVLHDVVEDSDWTLDQLRSEGFAEEIVAAVDALTKRNEEDYFAFVRRAGTNPLARIVKIADLRDNLDVKRMATLSERDHGRIRRYREALGLLGVTEQAG